MPGKHAPESSASFLLSLGRSVGGALAAVGVMVALVLVLLNRGGGDSSLGSPAIDAPSPTVSRTASPSPTPTTPTASPSANVLAPSRVTVAVLNSTNRSGLAARTADEIKAAGYKIAQVGNTASLAKSTIFYRPGRKEEALALQEAFPAFTVVRQGTASQTEFLRVVIGADFEESG